MLFQITNLFSFWFDFPGNRTVSHDSVDELEKTSAGRTDILHLLYCDVHLSQETLHCFHLQTKQEELYIQARFTLNNHSLLTIVFLNKIYLAETNNSKFICYVHKSLFL